MQLGKLAAMSTAPLFGLGIQSPASRLFRVTCWATQARSTSGRTTRYEHEYSDGLQHAAEVGSCLKAAVGGFRRSPNSEVWNEKILYVRDCYKDIADLMLASKSPYMSLLGSSGIGKSNFLTYLIWRRWQHPLLQDFPVFVHEENSIIKFERCKRESQVTNDDVRVAPEQSLYVMDADVMGKVLPQCASLWITSARRSNTNVGQSEHFKHAKKFGGQYFMPPWTLKEFLQPEVMNLHGFTEELVKERFSRFGGSARSVLAAGVQAKLYDSDLERALNDTSALTLVQVDSSMDISKTTHMLVKLHPKPGSNFSDFNAELSSPYVAQQLVRSNWMHNNKELWRQINVGYITGVGSSLFEAAFHHFMQDENNKHFKMLARRLHDKFECVLNFKGGLEGVLVVDVSSDVEEGKYYQPKSKIFTAVDSWSSQGMFQITTVENHDLKLGSKRSRIGAVIMKNHSNFDGKKFPFYIVVPPKQFRNNYKTKQAITAGETKGEEGQLQADEMSGLIEQWVVCFEQSLPN